jgi:hypothetical protein
MCLSDISIGDACDVSIGGLHLVGKEPAETQLAATVATKAAKAYSLAQSHTFKDARSHDIEPDIPE